MQFKKRGATDELKFQFDRRKRLHVYGYICLCSYCQDFGRRENGTKPYLQNPTSASQRDKKY
jgi:hypothetical protein